MKQWQVWTAAGVGAVGLAALVMWYNAEPTERAAPKRSVTLETHPAMRESAQVALLTRQVAQLREEVQGAQAVPALPVDSEPNESSREIESETELSPKEKREIRVTHYDQLLAAETRDAAAAGEFERTLDIGFSGVEHSSLEQVDCRTTLCRIEIRHNDRTGRERFGEFVLGSGPLKYGTFDYLSEDGERTIAYVGMPGHPLAGRRKAEAKLTD